jgi:hypothetical protein
VAQDFKYDVAFSFLSQDEALAERLHNIVSKSVSSFLYSKRQGEIVGTDGEVTFNRVFGDDARIVVVLYRAGWGETPFTRIEQTAIKNRAFDKGYDFVLMIPVDRPPTAPKWMPKPYLWCDLDRFGEETAAAIVEHRVRVAGGEPHQETAEENVARLGREMAAERQRKQTLTTEVGVKMALEEVETLFRELERVAKASSETSYRLEAERHPQGIRLLYLRGRDVTACVGWEHRFLNTLDESGLFVNYVGAPLRFDRQFFVKEPLRLGQNEFAFDVTTALKPAWRLNSRRTLSTPQLAAEIVAAMADHVRRRIEF